jgi:hypothetical protein
MHGRAGFLRRLALITIMTAALPACSARVSVEGLPTAEESLARIGRRLGASLALDELSVVAQRSERLLARLTTEERAALGQGAFRFHSDRPVIVTVVSPDHRSLFWLDDLGFHRVAQPIRVADQEWAVYRKPFPAGWVGLGVNGLDRTPTAHYLVFVHSVESAEGAGTVPTISRLAPEHWRLTTAREGSSAAVDRDLPLGPLPEELRGALLLRPAHDRRHAALLARGRIWKTHAASGRTPDQVSVAFGLDAARSLVWTWRTEPGVRTTALRLTNDPSRPFRTIEGDSHLVESPGLLNDPMIRRHCAAATDLTPGTAYSYSLGDGVSEEWTPWKVVRTAPTGPRPFRFLYLGDPQCGLEEWGKLLANAHHLHPDAAFLMIAGDLVDRGNERTNWDHFFLRAAGVFEELPLLPCAGNHEYLDQGPRLYRAVFALPANGPAAVDSGLVYSFEYGDAFFAVLDSTSAVSDARLAAKQAEWLDDRLARTRTTWKVVMFHHPVYASHPKRESPALRDAWVPVFDKHGVDLVLQGHDHAYLRTYPLRAGRRVEDAGAGTTYVVSVSGTKYYDQRPRPETAVGFTRLSTYQTIDIQSPENRLLYRAWDTTGREVDRVVMDKPGDAPRLAVRPGSSIP